jgi:cell division protein ZapA
VSDNTLKIKVTIANRVYPLTVKTEEEEQIRAAVKTINDSVSRLESRYAVQDKQDVLSMCALQLASKTELALKQSQTVQSQASEALAEVEAVLDAALQGE